MSMTNRERIFSSLRRRAPDRIPVGKVDFCGSLLKTFREKTGADDPNVYFNIPTRLVGGWASGASGAMVGGTHMWKGDIEYGQYLPPIPKDGRLMVKGDGYLIGEDDLEVYLFPLRDMTSIDELHRYPWWEAERKAAQSRSWRDLERSISELIARDLFVMGWVGNPFESAWKMRGFERFLLDMYEAPDFAAALLDLCTEACCANAEYVARRRRPAFPLRRHRHGLRSVLRPRGVPPMASPPLPQNPRGGPGHQAGNARVHAHRR